MPDSRERTAQEREAARLERERRRGEQRRKTSSEPAPAASGDGRPEPPAAPDPPAQVEHPDPATEEHDAGTEERDAGTEEHHVAGYEVPSGIRRVKGLRPGERKRKPAKPARTRKPAKPIGARTHSLRGRIVAVLALVLGAALVWFLIELFQPFAGNGHGSVVVTIPAKASAGQVGDELEREGVVSSSFFFGLRATLAGERGSLRAGTYHLKLGMTYGDVLKILTTAPPAARVTALTVIEGRTRRQLDTLLRSQGVKGSYLADTRRSPLLNPRTYGAPGNVGDLEGFLFPDTYQLREPVSIAALVADQLNQFKVELARVNLSWARRNHVTPYQLLTVASIVQGESPSAHDLPLIASVVYNRLHNGMMLQMDATVRYAVNNYTTPITQSQLHSSSPWNTYVHVGLPPTPIDNPGLAAIQAAAQPAHTSYLFFVAKPCGNGTSLFASSYSQFLREEASYQNARARRGGKSPTQCH